MQLLYVDDDRVNLMLFEAACALLPGVSLATAGSGAEAIAAVAEQRPDLLVIDLHLPDTDGHALLPALREAAASPALPAFLCSADEGDELRAEAERSGFAGCWTKPVDAGTLRRALGALGLLAGR
jgi:CheY-like chemotaxis protein